MYAIHQNKRSINKLVVKLVLKTEYSSKNSLIYKLYVLRAVGCMGAAILPGSKQRK